MKNDGFTLIELLSVIVVLGILALIITISTGKTINTSKTNLSKIQIQKIEEAAKLYYLSEGINDTSYDLDESKTCVNVSYLTENDYLEKSEIKNPEDNSNILGSVKIIYKSNKYSYEYQDTQCNHADYFVSVDAVCDLISDADNSNSVTLGDKYQCKVKDKMEKGFENGYYFYVLSYNDKDGNITEDTTKAKTINLIMDQNINSDGTPAGMVGTKKSGENVYNLVAWVSKADYDDDTNYGTTGNNNKGPITAMKFLYNATKDWTNIPALSYTYNDKKYQGTTDEESSYTSFVSSAGIATITSLVGTTTTIGTSDVPLRARMPIYASKDSTEHGEVAAKKEDNSNAYLYDNLDVNMNAAPYGYWTLSSDNLKFYASIVGTNWFDFGIITYWHVNEMAEIGVRPVITLGL